MRKPPTPFVPSAVEGRSSDHPQPLAGPGEQRSEHFQDEEEADAFSRWLAHLEAGRMG